MSTAASVSSVELNDRNAEIAPRVTGAVSTGTISAAAWRAFSFSVSAARLAAVALAFAAAGFVTAGLVAPAGPAGVLDVEEDAVAFFAATPAFTGAGAVVV